MEPARQGFAAGDAAAGQVEFRLVVEGEFFPFERLAQVLGQGEAAMFLHIAHGVENMHAALLALGAVHRQIGVLHERAEVVPVVGIQRDADAGAHRNGVTVGGDAGDQALVHCPREREGRVGIGVADQHGEFVAGNAAQGAAGLQQAVEDVGDRLEQQVAGLLAVAVVDVLEFVEVDQQHGEPRAHGAGDFDLVQAAVAEQRAVGQAGQRVEQGKLLELQVGVVEAAVQPLQFDLVGFRLAPGEFDLLHRHRVLDGDRRLGGEQLQQLEIALAELAAAQLVDADQAAEEAAPADQRRQQGGAGLVTPALAFLLVEFAQGAAPPGTAVAQHPAAQAEADRQRLADDLVGMRAGAGLVGVCRLFLVQYRHEQGFRLDQDAGPLGDRLERRVEVEFAADHLAGFQQEGDLAFALAQFLPKDIELSLHVGLGRHAPVSCNE